MEPWNTTDRRTILDEGKYLRVERHRVQLPDGNVIDDWLWLIMPDFVIVVIVTEDDQFVLFRQTKYGVEGTSLAPVGGYMEPGEDSLETAKREIREETGYESDDWQALGHFIVDGNRGGGTAHLYLAKNARFVGKVESDDLEEQEMLLMSRDEVQAALLRGEFQVLPWTTAFALTLLQI